MDASLLGLKNLGPTSVAMLDAVGIDSVEALHEAGSVLAYRILKHRYPASVNPLFLYAIEGALAGRHWASFSAEEKDRLKAAAGGDLVVGTA